MHVEEAKEMAVEEAKGLNQVLNNPKMCTQLKPKHLYFSGSQSYLFSLLIKSWSSLIFLLVKKLSDSFNIAMDVAVGMINGYWTKKTLKDNVGHCQNVKFMSLWIIDSLNAL